MISAGSSKLGITSEDSLMPRAHGCAGAASDRPCDAALIWIWFACGREADTSNSIVRDASNHGHANRSRRLQLSSVSVIRRRPRTARALLRGKRSIFAPLLRRGAWTGLFALLGCVSRPEYPTDWPAQQSASGDICPRIEGRYRNAGTVGGGGFGPAASGASGDRSKFQWDRDIDLSSNLLGTRETEKDRGRASRWVDLAQPDENTLVVDFDDAGPAIVLRQSDGDFRCNRGALVFSQYGSAIGHAGDDPPDYEVAGAVATGALLGIGGVEGIRRQFKPLFDSSLLMEVTESWGGAIFFIPAYSRRAEYVRWLPVAIEGEPDIDAP